MDARSLAGHGSNELRSQRMTRSLGIVLLMLLSVPALAEADMKLEPDIKASTDEALAAGFSILDMRDHHGTSARASIDEQIVGPVMKTLAPGRPYGFSFNIADLDGDGLDDVAIFLKAAGVSPPEAYPATGAPLLVYVRRDGWELALQAGAMALGIREAAGGGMEIALVQAEGLEMLRFDGDTVVPLD